MALSYESHDLLPEAAEMYEKMRPAYENLAVQFGVSGSSEMTSKELCEAVHDAMIHRDILETTYRPPYDNIAYMLQDEQS